jgi:hypothetical protein
VGHAEITLSLETWLTWVKRLLKHNYGPRLPDCKPPMERIWLCIPVQKRHLTCHLPNCKKLKENYFFSRAQRWHAPGWRLIFDEIVALFPQGTLTLPHSLGGGGALHDTIGRYQTLWDMTILGGFRYL